MEHRGGVEPPTTSFADLRPTAGLPVHMGAISGHPVLAVPTGLEPAIPSVTGWCALRITLQDNMVGRVGFEPTNLTEQIYSLPALTACIPAHTSPDYPPGRLGDTDGIRTHSLRLERAAS